MPRLTPSRHGTDPHREPRDGRHPLDGRHPRDSRDGQGSRDDPGARDRRYASARAYAPDGQGDPRARDHPDDPGRREDGRPGPGPGNGPGTSPGPSPDLGPGPGTSPGPTTAGPSPATAPRTGTRFGVPAFAHPLVAPAEWAELARPGAPLEWAAFDVARGPGSRADPLYAEAGARVRENGVPLLGRLDAARGTRPFGELVSDASRYLEWYGVDGFYLDRAPTALVDAGECHRVTSTLRALLHQEGRPGHLVLAPGTHPDPGYAGLADQLVTFAGPWERYRWSEAPQWTAAHPPSRFVHLVHGVPEPHLEGALRIARWQGAATVWVTDRTDRDGADPWAGLPGYWHRAVQAVQAAGGRPAAGVPPTM